MLHPARISSRSIMLHILQPYVVLWFCRVCQTQLRLMLPKIQLSALCSRDHVHGAARRRSALRRCADMYVCVAALLRKSMVGRSARSKMPQQIIATVIILQCLCIGARTSNG